MISHLSHVLSLVIVERVVIVSTTSSPAIPSTFLSPGTWDESAAEEAAKKDLLREVGVAVGYTSEFAKDLDNIEHSLLPIYKASPKNKHGRLDEVAARYALHRLFMERHGWDMRNFEETDAASDETARPCLFNFGRQVPYQIQAVLEKHVVERGSGMLELSVFAALLEYLISNEVPEKLAVVYRAMNISTSGLVNKRQVEDVIDVYMAAYIRSLDLSGKSPQQVYAFLSRMPFLYNNWGATKRYFRTIQNSVAPNIDSFAFDTVQAVILEIKEKFAHWNNHQCSSMQQKLMEMEMEGSGRVRLLDFYNAAIHKGLYQFSESTPYLRQLGALDESDPYSPALVISNYLDGPSNCVARTSYYSVCCMDQCVDLYGHLEKAIGKPETTPDEIISLVKELKQKRSQNQGLSDALVQRLHAIGKQNHGLVSLHGQSFAEWMHFVFPRDCTNPSMFGPAHFKIMEDWEKETHLPTTVNTVELKKYATELKKLFEMRPDFSNDTVIVASNLVAPASWIEDSRENIEQPPAAGSQMLQMMVLPEILNGKISDLLCGRTACVLLIIILLQLVRLGYSKYVSSKRLQLASEEEVELNSDSL